ncbi:hypothetical protein VaNZ11_013869, partial [Volvox africanus]
MRQSITRQFVVQHETSRPSLPPPRASSGGIPAQNVPSTPPQAQLPVGPASIVNSVTQTPAYAPPIHAPVLRPSSVYSPPGAYINSAPAYSEYSCAPQTDPNAFDTSSDLGQRALMEYIALVQDQLAAVNQVVASTVAQNQALTAQNQALLEELKIIKHQVQALTGPWAVNQAAAAMDAGTLSEGPPIPSGVPRTLAIAATQPQLAVAALAATSEAESVATREDAIAEALSQQRNSPSDGAATKAAAPSAPTTAALAATGIAQTAQARKPLLRQLLPLSPVPSSDPVVEAKVQPQLNAVVMSKPGSESSAPANVLASDVYASVECEDTPLQLLSLVASELASLTEVANPGAGGAAQPAEALRSSRGATAVTVSLSGPMSRVREQPQSSATKSGEAATVAIAAAHNGYTVAAMPEGTVAAPPQSVRLQGRGGRYVGPPRAGLNTGGAPSVATSSWRGIHLLDGAQASTGATPTGTSSGAAAGNRSSDTVSSSWAGITGRGGKRIGAGSTPGAVAGPGDGAANAVSVTNIRTANDEAVEPSGAATAGIAVGAAAVMEKRIRLSSTAKEIRAIIEEECLSPQQVVLAAKQLPCIARLAQERQQELLGSFTASKDAEAELMTLRELFLRLTARFHAIMRSNALASLRPAFLPSYLELTAVSGELCQPPSRSFASALRQMVAQHVDEVAPEVAAAAVAAVAQLDGTVAPGVLERACKVVAEGRARLVDWKALVAAGQIAPLGRIGVEAAQVVLNDPETTSAVDCTSNVAVLDAEAVLGAARGVLACNGAGVTVPPVRLRPLEAACRGEGVLAVMGPSGQLLVARAFVAAGCEPEDVWLDMWERQVVASMSRASPMQVAALAAALHALACIDAAHCSGRPRRDFVAAASERLLSGSLSAGVTSGASACALAQHIGELSAGANNGNIVVPPHNARRLAAALLSIATVSLASLDLPHLAALVSGLSLLEVSAPAEVWSALLSRATDERAAMEIATAAARRALELGLPGGIKPASLEHFLSVGGRHVGELPAASLVGLLGLVAAVDGEMRPRLMSVVLTRLYDQAAELGPRDVAFLFAAMDALSVLLTQPLTARTPVVAGDKQNGDCDAADAAASRTPAMVLHRTAEAVLVPEQVLATLGLERTAELLELVARLQQTVTAASRLPLVPEEGSAGSASVASDVESSSGDGCGNCRLMPRRHVLELLRLLQPMLSEASPKVLATLVISAAALELPVEPDWLAAIVANILSAALLLDPMTWSRIAAALTRCEQLAGLAPGSAGGNWLDAFLDGIQNKVAAAPPAALALTLQVLVSHSRQPSASWTTSFLAAAMSSLEARLPLTQAQAAGAAAAAASIAAGRARPAGRHAAAGPMSSSTVAVVATTSSKLPQQQAPDVGPVQGPVASAFTPQQLSHLLSGLAALQLRQYVTSAWLVAAARQVEGRAVHFTYRDLTEALYGIVRLGGCVRDAACNQLFIVSLTKMSTTTLALLARTLAVAAAAEGRKVSPKWWEEAQRAIIAKLGGADVALTADAANDVGTAAATWQTSDLCLAVESVLTLHRQKDVGITDALATMLAEVVWRDRGSGGAAVAAALSPDAAVFYVEACGKTPQLGRPPLILLEQYLSYSTRLLGKFAAGDDRQAADLGDFTKLQQHSEPSSTTRGGATGKRERKRARERVAKQAGGSAVPVASPFLEHLQSAITVGRMLVGTPDSERPTTAPQWFMALAAGGAAAARSLSVSSAAGMLWLLAKLEGSAGGSAVVAEQRAALAEQVQGLVARVSDSAADACRGAAAKTQRSALAHDAVVETVWALQALGFAPSEELLQGLSHALPGRLATLSPAEVLPLLKALSDGGAAGARAVTEADIAPSPAAGPGRAAVAGTGGGAAASVYPSLKLATELGQYLEVHLPDLSDSEIVTAMALAVKLDLALPPAVIAVGSTRLARSAMTGLLRGKTLFQAVLSLNKHGAKPPEDELEQLCDAVAESALDGTLGGVLQIANAAAAIYDMGARPGPEWLGMVGEAVLDDLAGGTSSHGSVRRPPLTARGLIIALHELSARYEANHVTLAMAACRAAMDDLEGQLALAQGVLVPHPLQHRQGWGWMAPAAPTDSANLGVGQSQRPGNDEEEDEGLGVSEEEVLGLDPELLTPLRLADMVRLLTGLIEARQEPPKAFWELLERALRPSLHQQQSLTNAGSGGSAPALLQISDGDLCELLAAMRRMSSFPSEAFLQDMEGYLGRRMPLQGHRLLAFFSSHCVARGYTPEPKFMRLFRQRVEEVLSQVDTQSALLLVHFLLVEAIMGAPQGAERSGDSGRALEKRKQLLQGLLECTEGQELLMFAEMTEGDSRTLVILLTSLIGNFGLRPPHATSPERRAAWLTAMQALTIGCMDHIGWDHVATLLWLVRGSGFSPEGEWLTAFYMGLEASASTAAPHEVAAAAIAIGRCGFVPALAPTLPARLAAVLETRMREFASIDPRILAQLLYAIGEMGHTVRTEVLQAAEVLMEQPLARAPEVLWEARMALSALPPTAARTETEATAEAEARLMATAGAAEELLCEENLLTSCLALWIHGYRPGPRLADALMNAAGILHGGTQQLLQEMKAADGRSGPPPISSCLSWSNLKDLSTVLTVLVDWDVQPTEQWRDAAATALVALAMFGGQQQEETALVKQAAAALERLGHQLSNQEVLALQRLVEARQYGYPVDQRVMQMINDMLTDILAKSFACGDGAGPGEAPLQPPVKPLHDGPKAAWPGRRTVSSKAVAPMDRISPQLGGVAFTSDARMFSAGSAAQAGVQQGPVATADYRDLNAGPTHGNRQGESSERPTDAGQPLQLKGGSKIVALSEAAEAIVEALNATEHEGQTSGAAMTDFTATEAVVMPVEAEAARAASMAVEPSVAQVQVQERPMMGPASVPVDTTPASLPPENFAAEYVKPEGMKPMASQSSELAPDAPSSRVSFRRLTPAERTAAGTRAAPPIPPTYSDGSMDESMRLA